MGASTFPLYTVQFRQYFWFYSVWAKGEGREQFEVINDSSVNERELLLGKATSGTIFVRTGARRRGTFRFPVKTGTKDLK